jgi:hypothetical protein
MWVTYQRSGTVGEWQGSGRVVAESRHGMCELAFNAAWERHGMCELAFNAAWERHGMCELAFNAAWERHGMCESALTLQYHWLYRPSKKCAKASTPSFSNELLSDVVKCSE